MTEQNVRNALDTMRFCMFFGALVAGLLSLILPWYTGAVIVAIYFGAITIIEEKRRRAGDKIVNPF